MTSSPKSLPQWFALFAAALLTSAPAWAQAPAADSHAAHHTAAANAQQADLSEGEGTRVDAAALQALGREYTQKAEQLREDVYRLSGERGFNLNSPQQLGEVLFVKLGLKAGKKTQRGYSTDAVKQLLQNSLRGEMTV